MAVRTEHVTARALLATLNCSDCGVYRGTLVSVADLDRQPPVVRECAGRGGNEEQHRRCPIGEERRDLRKVRAAATLGTGHRALKIRRSRSKTPRRQNASASCGAEPTPLMSRGIRDELGASAIGRRRHRGRRGLPIFYAAAVEVIDLVTRGRPSPTPTIDLRSTPRAARRRAP